MMYVLDPQTGHYLWRCPECGETIRLTSFSAICLVKRAGCCQGCRARATFERNPGLAGFFLDFWAGADAWPQSASWLEALPAAGVSILGNAYSTGGRLGLRSDCAALRLEQADQAG
jgi:hypothetical protein